MAERLKYGSMDKPKGDAPAPKAEDKAAPAADAAPKADAAAESTPKADGGEPKADAKPVDPKARQAAAVKLLRDGHKTERRDMHKRHLGDYESMQARHDKATEDMTAANDLELAGPDPAPEAPAAE